MSWIQTYTGRRFDFLEATADDIDIQDIAHSLSMQCRFNGHCREFYSVAQHGVLESRLVGAPSALWGLMHDGVEAYVSDMVTPLKAMLAEFRLIEQRTLLLVAEKFGLSLPIPAEVKAVDLRVGATEERDLMPAVTGTFKAEPYEMAVMSCQPESAYRLFMERFEQLTTEST